MTIFQPPKRIVRIHAEYTKDIFEEFFEEKPTLDCEESSACEIGREPHKRRSRSSRSLSPSPFSSVVASYHPSLSHSRRFPKCFLHPCLHSALSTFLPLFLSRVRFLAPLPLSVPAITFALSSSFSPPRSPAIVLSSARVFRDKRPGLVDGPSHGLQLSCSLIPSCLSIPFIHRLSCLPSLSDFRRRSPFFSVTLSA